MPAFRTHGNPTALAAVRRAIASQRPPHALLLVGPAGVGKTTLALDLAAGLLCLSGDPGTRPCGVCPACRKVGHGNHPDLHRVAPDGAGGQVRLAQVHELQSALALRAMEGRFRLAIVEQAHRLNADAQNALLKTLEEPPPDVVIVLAADDEQVLLPTVRSRCARLRLVPVGSGAIADLLAERGVADAPRASALGRLSGGSPGLALALASAPEAVVAYDRLVRRLLDLMGSDRRARLSATAELLADGAAVATAIERNPGPVGDGPATDEPPGRSAQRQVRAAAPAERRAATLQIVAAWRALTRDLCMAAIPTSGRSKPSPASGVELLEEIEAAAAAASAIELTRFLRRLDGVAAALEAYANPELALDMLLLAWPRLAPASTARTSA